MKILVGQDSEGSSQDAAVIDAIMDFFGMLESVPTYTNAVCCVSIEGNLNWIWANRVRELLQKRGGHMKFIFINFDVQNKGRDGCWTSDISKELMVEEFRNDLANGLFRVAREFVSRDPLVTLKKLAKQMKQFRKYVKAAIANGTAGVTTTIKNTIWKYDGKANGEPDDLIFGLIMARWYALMTNGSQEFQYLASANGWIQ